MFHASTSNAHDIQRDFGEGCKSTPVIQENDVPLQKVLAFEKKHGNEETVEGVKKKVVEYLEAKEKEDRRNE